MKYNKMVKNTMSLGMSTMAGGFALGTMANMPGMPAEAKGTANIAMTGMNLANIGNLANVGMNIMPTSKGKKSKW